MTVHDFAQILRTRWLIILGTTALVVLAALAYSLLATPRYQSSTRLFVSTTSDGTNTQTNDGGLFAQRRALSYTQLLTGGVVAQRTIDKLGLDMTVPALQREITASTPTDTVLIDLTVQDPSAVRARDIANTLSDEFVVMAAGLETPDLGARPNARVIVQQSASIPDAPVSPKTLQNLAIGFALGALLGLFAAIVRYRFDDRMTTAEHIEKATGVGLVADIPSDVSRRKEPLLAFGGDQSAIADAFRELRVNLQSLQVGSGSRVLLVTSSMPEEGRTTTAVNLALALAEADHTVVIVDGDLRRPRVASCLGVDGQRGVSTVLAGEARLDETLQDTRFPGLTAIASGVAPTNPTQLLGSSTAKDLFDGTEQPVRLRRRGFAVTARHRCRHLGRQRERSPGHRRIRRDETQTAGTGDRRPSTGGRAAAGRHPDDDACEEAARDSRRLLQSHSGPAGFTAAGCPRAA